MGVVIPAGDQGVREFTEEVEEGPCLLEDFLQEVDSMLSSTGGGGLLGRRTLLSAT